MQINCTNHLEDWQKKLLAESTGIILYTAKNDYMFKAICQTNTYALKGLLCFLQDLFVGKCKKFL